VVQARREAASYAGTDWLFIVVSGLRFQAHGLGTLGLTLSLVVGHGLGAFGLRALTS
jgi:hypothetical protein